MSLRSNDELFAERHEKYKARKEPSCGDFVVFADDITRRISHVWTFDGKICDIQTSDGGSFYLQPSGLCDFSGGLYRAVSYEHFTLSKQTSLGECWLFDRDLAGAGRGVYRQLPFKVWHVSCPAPKR